MASESDTRDITKRFGELAVENGFASASEIDVALKAQKHTDPSELSQAAHLGQILLDMGTLTPEQVEAVLLAQTRLKRRQAGPVLDTETDTKIFVPREFMLSAASLAAEPVGWLILETEGRSSNAFPVREKAILGRAATHEVPVPDMLASRDHACVEYIEGRHVLTDLASRNGTYLNEENVDRPIPLKAGDRIRIGQIILRYAPGTKTQETKVLRPPQPGSDIEEKAGQETEPIPVVPPAPEAKDPAYNPTADDSSTSITPISDLKPPAEEPEEITEEPKAEEKPATPAPAPKIRPQLEEAKKAARIAARGLSKVFQKFDELVDKIPPKIHTQRKYVAFGCFLGILAVFMPWIIEANTTHLGLFTGTGWVTLTFFAATMALVLIKAGQKPVEFKLLLAVVPLPLLAGLFALLAPVKDYQHTGFGMWLTMVVGVVTAVLAFVTRGNVAPEPEDVQLVSDAPPVESAKGGFKGFAGRFMEKTKRLAKDVSGKRAKDKAQAAQQRDALLLEIADAALQAKLDAPEAAAATKAKETFDTAHKKSAAAGAKGAVQRKQQVKAAESMLQRARLKLARAVIDRTLPVEGAQSKIDEVKSLDESVKDLS